MLPERYDAAIVERIAAEGLVGLVERDERVVAVGLLYPLHTLQGVGQDLLAGLAEPLIL